MIQEMCDKIEDHDWGQWPEGPSIHELGYKALEMEEAMTEFVRRVEEGSIRSRKTYTKFKSILEMK